MTPAQRQKAREWLETLRVVTLSRLIMSAAQLAGEKVQYNLLIVDASNAGRINPTVKEVNDRVLLEMTHEKPNWPKGHDYETLCRVRIHVCLRSGMSDDSSMLFEVGNMYLAIVICGLDNTLSEALTETIGVGLNLRGRDIRLEDEEPVDIFDFAQLRPSAPNQE